MEKATAEVSLDIWVHCAHCEEYQDVTEKLREELQDDLRAENIDREITCVKCKEVFIVDNITY